MTIVEDAEGTDEDGDAEPTAVTDGGAGTQDASNSSVSSGSGPDAGAGTETTVDTSTTTTGARDERTESGADTDDYTRKKCVLITGCSSGIGRATAQAFLEEEWRVVATARNTDDIADLAEAGCVTHELDVTDPDQVARTVERTVELGGAIDCVVNNAGYAQMGPLEDVSMNDLHRQFDVNVYGPHRLTRAALPHMRAQGKGRIINISSVLGRVAFPGTGAYSGTKFALEAMSDSLRGEVEEFDIDVVVVEPGPVDTSFVDRVDDELPDENRTPAYEELYELYDDAQLIGGGGPLAVDPEEVATAILQVSTCVEPPARYPVGTVAQFGIYARYLPDTVRDAAYGLLRKLV
ncbi:SDR family oxidoreductase [Natronoglomus mannanivorans]|uniref:SDR family oxidoreductase n=1 Tax=Natronoglomus mannanivorans TaxID=2979990 RepID=A0AAP3E028_9EURY|nr:SDR family oxidoreductase [Halobacteria archaeon AArc-xg1-1]